VAPPAAFPTAYTNARGEFVIHGDTRPWMLAEVWRKPSGDERRAVIARLAEERPDFIVNTGDLVAAGSMASQWTTFDEETAPLREQAIAYFASLGGHDLWPIERVGLEHAAARFPYLAERIGYGLRHGYVDVIVLDSTASGLPPEQQDAQSAWLRDRFSADDADPSVRCVIVACHHTPMTNSASVGDSEWIVRHVLEPGRKCRKFKALFGGHTHSYEHFLADGVHVVVSGGGGAPLMDVAGPGGTHRDLYDGPRGHHYCRLTPRVDRVDVDVVMLAADGTWFDADHFAITVP
jgi:3',5'-cyclic AMP phosphodiesterase CpdA